ncbi:hypothetical protein B0H67DRAFT_655811 [Lasiosphaeris hirsuta]|uniref:Uncharacterized protein n=1 Tax=Lasiosphaeris hirsuta TaxID=260670 RepID=A0AA40BDN0_9PEZI|nr:hypothetical protein B0H67DRAFT_655811 [Lasiosphaeris hirsuta]
MAAAPRRDQATVQQPTHPSSPPSLPLPRILEHHHQPLPLAPAPVHNFPAPSSHLPPNYSTNPQQIYQSHPGPPSSYYSQYPYPQAPLPQPRPQPLAYPQGANVWTGGSGPGGVQLAMTQPLQPHEKMQYAKAERRHQDGTRNQTEARVSPKKTPNTKVTDSIASTNNKTNPTEHNHSGAGAVPPSRQPGPSPSPNPGSQVKAPAPTAAYELSTHV